MSRLRNDEHAFIELTFSTLGLFIATGILLVAVVSCVFANDWQREAELDSIARSFVHFVETMDARSYENSSTFTFPDKGYAYTVEISSEYIVMKAKGFRDTDLVVVRSFIVQPWPLHPDFSVWMGSQQLHQELKNYSGTSGNFSNPVFDTDVVKSWLDSIQTSDSQKAALTPLLFTQNSEIIVDKAVIYYDVTMVNISRTGNRWNATDPGSEIETSGDDAHMSSFIGEATVYYYLTLPSGVDIQYYSMEIGTCWLENGVELLQWGDGPQLCIYNWYTDDYLPFLVEDLGYTGNRYEWRWDSVSQPSLFVQNNEIHIRYSTDGDGWIDDTCIRNVCVKLEADVSMPKEQQSFILIYEK